MKAAFPQKTLNLALYKEYFVDLFGCWSNVMNSKTLEIHIKDGNY